MQHLFLRNLKAQKMIHLCRLKGKLPGLYGFRIDIHHTLQYLAASHLLDELACTIDGLLGKIRIQSLFKLTCRIRTKSQTPLGQTDIGPVEAGCLEKQRSHGIRDHGVLASHDTTDGYLFLPVADHQHIFIQCTLYAVQCLEYISVLCALYHDLMPCNGVEVKCMHGLSVLFHHIVCDIHDIIDGTDPLGTKSLLQPLR